ncbi:hypothetical protein ABZ351_10230 [Streptomyces microflavus]|uniref:hypothetical protein n=1 Tax=Streptomyces TaxID=1883 RepID=UPI002F91ADE2|nr:hypothetical protein OG215_37240 [Streptomyces globisporus]
MSHRSTQLSRRENESLYHLTVTGGDQEVIDTILAERNPEYSEEERGNLLNRGDKMFVVAYLSQESAETAAELFQLAGANVVVNETSDRSF